MIFEEEWPFLLAIRRVWSIVLLQGR